MTHRFGRPAVAGLVVVLAVVGGCRSAKPSAGPSTSHGAGKEGNWIQTLPGKNRLTMLRLYGPLQP